MAYKEIGAKARVGDSRRKKSAKLVEEKAGDDDL